jgi:hypothetical protein
MEKEHGVTVLWAFIVFNYGIRVVLTSFLKKWMNGQLSYSQPLESPNKVKDSSRLPRTNHPPPQRIDSHPRRWTHSGTTYFGSLLLQYPFTTLISSHSTPTKHLKFTAIRFSFSGLFVSSTPTATPHTGQNLCANLFSAKV